MKTIWKFTLEPENVLNLPKGSIVLDIQSQFNQPQMWVLVDPDEDAKEERTFKIYGTGHIIEDDPGKYIGTFQLNKGSLVFHVFEE